MSIATIGKRRLWLPRPPASYTHTAGAFTTSVVDNDPGNTSPLSAHYPSWQHVVSNQYGIFVVFRYQTSPTYQFRIRRSQDNGLTWSTVFDSVNDQEPANSSNPAIETDERGNIYVVCQYSPDGNWINGPCWFYKFAASENFAVAHKFVLGVTSSGKHSTFYDQGRGWVWVLLWGQYGANGPTFYAVDTNGVVRRSVRLWGVSGGSGTTFYFLHYPVLSMDIYNDEIYLGITTSDFHIVPQNYYDNRMLYSPDGGLSFYGRTGKLTPPIDPLSDLDSQNPLWQLTDVADASQFIAQRDPLYNSDVTHTNFNLMSGFAYNKGKVHAYFQSEDTPAQPTAHRCYSRWDRATLAVDQRLKNWTLADGTAFDNADGGNFITDVSQKGRLFFVGPGTATDHLKIVAVYSDDGGTTWSTYGKTTAGATGVTYVQGFRWVRTDGSLIGISANFGTPSTVWFWRLDPA